MKVFRLYRTSACHLCEMAIDMVTANVPPRDNVKVEQVDVSESDELFELYGLRIPVLQHPDQRELNWPFTPLQVKDFLAS